VNSRPLLAAASILLAACGGPEGSPLSGLPLALHSPGPTTLLRLPAKGGDAVAYRTSDLAPLGWKVQKVPPIRQYVGVDLDLGLLYAVDSARGLVAVDLRSERARVLRRGVRAAALAPDGSLFSVDTAGAVTQVRGRRPVIIGDRLPTSATSLVGAANGRLLSLPTPRRADLTVYEPNSPAASIALVAAPSTATLVGDLVAVAADSAVILADPTGQREPQVVEVAGGARAVAFSPSGHRFYVAGRKDRLQVFDRFGGRELHDIDLPAPGREVRGDIYGLWLLVRSEVGDSVWVVDVAARRVVATAATGWDADLPLIAPPSLLLVRRGRDVVGLSLGAEGLKEAGRVAGAGTDLWIPLAWSPPSSGRGPLAGGDSMLAADSAGGNGPRFYLQVSSSRNPEWARELSSKITEAGIAAGVMEPANADDVYRVVVGPFAAREQADSASRSLGMPSFVITAPGAAAR
jgi:hypothetical protein